MEKNMKLVKYHIAASTLLLFMVISSVAKQPPPDLGYEPPAGWEFVMKLDSVSYFDIYSHNDTCYLWVDFSTISSQVKEKLIKLTTDGGLTWTDNPEIPLPLTFIKNTLICQAVRFEKPYYYYKKSYDFFKTSEKYIITGEANLPFDSLYQSPVDTNILIATFKSIWWDEDYTKMDQIERGNMNVFISYDAGKTWKELSNLYRYQGIYTLYEFNFDWAEKGHWFVSAIYGSNLGYKNYSLNFETFDDGKTFREIKFKPTSLTDIDDNYLYSMLFGIDGKKTLREASIYSASGITLKEYDDTIRKSTFYDWLYLMDPTKPKTNLDSGYRRAFSFIKGFYQFDNSNFDNIFISVYEHKGDLKNSNFSIERYFYSTTNKGRNWELINHFKEVPYFSKSFLDQGTTTLWIYVKDEKYQKGKKSFLYKGSLWKLKLPWKTTSVESIGNKDGINIYPNPAVDFITISLESWSPPSRWTPTKIEIFDILGVKVISEAIHPMTSSHRMNLENLPAGVYFIKIGDKVEKFVKM